MFKLVLEKAEEPEIKLPTSTGSSKSKRVPEKHLLLLYWLYQSLWWCGSQQTVENSSGDGNIRPLTCLLRKLHAGRETTVRTGHGTTDWFQIGKGVHKGCLLSLCLFHLYAEYIVWNAGWMKHKLENLENSAVATALEKVSFHSSPKERQCQRMLKLQHNCTHLTC